MPVGENQLAGPQSIRLPYSEQGPTHRRRGQKCEVQSGVLRDEQRA
jgi:hypothetical protein